MATILNVKGSLFDAPKGSLLIHAVSTKSVWGSGIALQFKAKFPESFEFYQEMCKKEGMFLLGTTIFCPPENDYNVTALVTSLDYGDRKDSMASIIRNTRFALQNLLWLEKDRPTELHSCKFNSGLFGVPWKETEKVLIDELDKCGYTKPWTVWEQ